MILPVDLKSEYLSIKEEIDSSISRVLESGNFILGNECKLFEKEFADYLGAKYAVSLNSGTDALYLIIKAMELQPGDEIILPSHTFVSTADAVARNGVRPVFADINSSTFLIDPRDVIKKISDKTKAIIAVHLYGQPADMAELREISEKYNISLIEDACQSHGASYEGRKTGTIGDAAAFSFYPTKNLGAYGDGGMVTTNNSTLYERIKSLRNYGEEIKYVYKEVGINSRLDEIQAAILRVKLKHLDKWNERRIEIAQLYNEYLSDSEVVTPAVGKSRKHVYHQYVIKTSNRDKLIKYLEFKGIKTLIHYPVPIHKQKSYLDMGYDISLPVTERITKEVVSLPMNPFITDETVKYIADAIRKA